MTIRLNGKTLAGIETGGLPVKASLVMSQGRVRVSINIKERPGDPTHDSAAEDVSYIAIEDGGAKTNFGAVVAFGVLGLGARRDWTVVTVGYPDGDVVLGFRKPLQVVRTEIKKGLVECPDLAGRVFDGPPPTTQMPLEQGVPSSKSDADAILDRLERLTELHNQGSIDADEFARLKKALIDELP